MRRQSIFTLLIILALLPACRTASGDSDRAPDIIPEICLIVPSRYNSPGWIDFGDVDGDGDQDVIISHWQLPENRKGIEVWRNNGPVGRPALIWYDRWYDPRPYLSYPDTPWEQGPLVAANFKGGDGGRVEIAYLHHAGGRYTIRMVSGNDGKVVAETPLEKPVSDLIAVRMSKPDRSGYSDLLAVFRSRGKLARTITCYRMPALRRRWSYDIEQDGRFIERFSCHRVMPLPWPNGKDVVWFGGGILDWNGGGKLGASSYGGAFIPLLDPGGRDDYNRYHWDSCASFSQHPDPPVIIATTCSNRVWRFPALSTVDRSGVHEKMRAWVYQWDRQLEDPSTHHIHRLRLLDNRLLLFSDVHEAGYRVGVLNRETMNIKWMERITTEEAERIEWDGKHGQGEILTETGIYNYRLEMLSERRGTSILENNFICDLWGMGHQQYGYARRNEGRWETVFVANPHAEKSAPVPIDVNHHFY